MKTLLTVLTLAAFALPAAAQTPGLPQTPPVWDDIRAKQLEQDKKLDLIMARLGIPQTPPVMASAVTAAPAVVRQTTTTTQSFSGVVPAGMHAHRRVDGSVFVHSHANHGDAAAHAGVAAPWVQIATAGQYVPPQFGVAQPGPVFTAAPAYGSTFGFPVPATSGSFTTTTKTTGSFGDCPNGQCPNQQFSTPVRSGLRRVFN